MKKIVPLLIFFHFFSAGNTQNFQIENNLKTYYLKPGILSSHVVQIRNNSDKHLNLGVRKPEGINYADQINQFCLKNNCDLTPGDVLIEIGPGEINNTLSLVFESGLTAAGSNINYELFNLNDPSEAIALRINYVVEEDITQKLLYKDESIEISPIYPNPITQNFGIIDYRLHDKNLNAKIILHNILGNKVAEYEMSPSEQKLKISTSELEQGVYFYSLQSNNKTLFTRKLIVRK